MIVSTASSSSSFFLYRSVEEKKNRIGQKFLEKENILSVEEKKNGEYWEKESDDGQTDSVTSCGLDPFCVNYQNPLANPYPPHSFDGNLLHV